MLVLLSRQTAPRTLSLLHQDCYLGVSYRVPLIVNKSLGHTSPIGPLLVSCLILSAVALLLPLQSYFVSLTFDLIQFGDPPVLENGDSVCVAMRLPSQLHLVCCTQLPQFLLGDYCSPSSDEEWRRMRLQAHSIWTALVHPPSFFQVANRYTLPTGQHLDTLIQQGGAPPFQFLDFVQDSVGQKTWADAQ